MEEEDYVVDVAMAVSSIKEFPGTRQGQENDGGARR